MELSFHVYIFPLELAICSTNRYNKYNTKYNKNPTFFRSKTKLFIPWQFQYFVQNFLWNFGFMVKYRISLVYPIRILFTQPNTSGVGLFPSSKLWRIFQWLPMGRRIFGVVYSSSRMPSNKVYRIVSFFKFGVGFNAQ